MIHAPLAAIVLPSAFARSQFARRLSLNVDDFESGFLERCVNRCIDVWISSFQSETANANTAAIRLRRLCRSVLRGKAFLEKFHSLHRVRDVFAHRADGIEMFWLDRVNAFHRNQTLVVFRPTIPQHAAGTRIDPAVSVPKATSASPLASATAFPDEDPPGIKSRSSGFTGVPK